MYIHLKCWLAFSIIQSGLAEDCNELAYSDAEFHCSVLKQPTHAIFHMPQTLPLVAAKQPAVAQIQATELLQGIFD